MEKFVIVGCPNSGKTTLFNQITKSHSKTGNFSGVTVEAEEKIIKYGSKKYSVVDLPGLNLLSAPLSQDEENAKEYLLRHKNEKIIFLFSLNNIQNGIELLFELISMGVNLYRVIINSFGKKVEAEKIKEFQKLLKVPLLFSDCKKERKQILNFIFSLDSASLPQIVDKNKLKKIFSPTKSKITKWDRLLLHPFWGVVIFLLIFSFIIFISYGPPGNFLLAKLQDLVDPVKLTIIKKLQQGGNYILASIVDSVIFGGVVEICLFIPQLMLMLFGLYLLSSSGIMPRFASLFNTPAQKLGLSGKSLFAVMMGVGCTTSGAVLTKNLSDSNQKYNTLCLIPFFGCLAKIPVLVFISSWLFRKINYFVVMLVFVYSVVLGLCVLKVIYKKTKEDFVMELPGIKFPSILDSLKEAFSIVLELIKRVVFAGFICAGVIWLLSSFDTHFVFNSGSKSILDVITSRLVPIFAPIGITDGKIITALILGLVAKENILVALGTLKVVGVPAGGIIPLMIFIILYPPCVLALKATSKEIGKIKTIKLALMNLTLAYLSAFIFYTFSLVSLWLGVIMLVCFILLLLGLSGIREKTCDCWNQTKNCKCPNISA